MKNGNEIQEKIIKPKSGWLALFIIIIGLLLAVGLLIITIILC